MANNTEHTYRVTFSELLVSSKDAFDSQLEQFFEQDDELTFQVRMPSNEDSTPPGLLIYISPKQGARMPEAWGAILDQHNLVWVGAENSGNEVHVARRVGLALLAPSVAGTYGQFDLARVYLSGFSGGGRVASMMIPSYPTLFSGAIFICGANPVMVATEETVAQIEHLPLVFLTGTGDFNLEDTQWSLQTYQQAGLSRAQLMVIEGLDHALPEASAIDDALNALS
ncbi:MAG: hypothetical protein GKR90_09870 [Pseudomonadales bacterium]|nr:hypothetical protein [Pseudomonadales bacterium]